MYKREEEDGEGLGVVIQMNSHLTQTKQHLCKEKGDELVCDSSNINRGKDELVCGSYNFSDNASFNGGSPVGRKEKGETKREKGKEGFSAWGPKLVFNL